MHGRGDHVIHASAEFHARMHRRRQALEARQRCHGVRVEHADAAAQHLFRIKARQSPLERRAIPSEDFVHLAVQVDDGPLGVRDAHRRCDGIERIANAQVGRRLVFCSDGERAIDPLDDRALADAAFIPDGGSRQAKVALTQPDLCPMRFAQALEHRAMMLGCVVEDIDGLTHDVTGIELREILADLALSRREQLAHRGVGINDLVIGIGDHHIRRHGFERDLEPHVVLALHGSLDKRDPHLGHGLHELPDFVTSRRFDGHIELPVSDGLGNIHGLPQRPDDAAHQHRQHADHQQDDHGDDT